MMEMDKNRDLLAADKVEEFSRFLDRWESKSKQYARGADKIDDAREKLKYWKSYKEPARKPPIPPSGGAPGVVTPAPSIGERSSSYTERAANIEMVSIPGGAFDMGSNDGDADEKPVHRVYVDGFYMGKYEVTQAQWQAVMGNNPSSFKGDNLPVEKVSWDDCQEFIRKLNSMTGKTYRLPTEAEWEYACRAGTKTKYYWGDNFSNAYQYANFADKNADYSWSDKTQNDGFGNTSPVGSYKPNGYGLYDMSGNVWEWCGDWYAENYYGNSLERNPTGAGSGSSRVLRGGSWYADDADMRSALRGGNEPASRSGSIGVRLVSPSRTP